MLVCGCVDRDVARSIVMLLVCSAALSGRGFAGSGRGVGLIRFRGYLPNKMSRMRSGSRDGGLAGSSLKSSRKVRCASSWTRARASAPWRASWI